MTEARTVFVVSDATGHTAEKLVQAALVQFGPSRVNLRVFPRIRTPDEIAHVMATAELRGALVLHTLVDPGLRKMTLDLASRRNVRCLDLIGGLLESLAEFLDSQPRGAPGVPMVLDERYFRRVEAVEFAVAADDGQSPDLLERADIVLVGVSRTSKTPVSAYLANQGYKVANVPLTMGIEPPAALFELPGGRVYALTIDPMKLTDIRQRRIAQYGFEDGGSYADPDHVFAEVRWALQIFRRRSDWPILDVTRLAVEETASEILKRKAQLEEAAP